FLPLGYFAAALAMAVFLLPSALRPPTQQPNQTAELSPNAPPDKNQAAVIGSFQRASSGVAAPSPGGPSTTVAKVTTTTVPAAAPAVVQVARACPHGFGSPPRQVESIYAPPCAAPWSGNNGGSTWKGVTSNEIRIGVTGCDQNGS